jgi:hypothetical protein
MLSRALKPKLHCRLLALGVFALCGCSEPSGFTVQGLMPAGDYENHPAALRDVADVTQSATLGGTINALFSFPDPQNR